MQLKLMWCTIAVIVIGLFSVVASTYKEDSRNITEIKQDENKRSIIEAAKEKDKKLIPVVVDPANEIHSLDNNLVPDVFAYRYNSFFETMEINGSVDFSEGALPDEIFAKVGDKITINGVTHPDTLSITNIRLLGVDLKSADEIENFKNILFAFFISVVDQNLTPKEIDEIFYDELECEKIIQNGGGSEALVGEIKYNFSNEESEMSLRVTNINND
ncbi:hypothetical protein I6J18_02535 [Peribacillus psychrosaccharolyticus]|uniref:Uncharacterized protein n=1 Tax=Peribacillus psychrosaccharolyticus TaxID=1407 RepID=A0A974NNH1_PERPY|nr:hypothetical protein [Peribacillus psychrosaccharolyticus]MEC2055969.1 hypothetical protein [Peribacillus psychrosaccharolyticus]MED3743143.1 hypothetical protein [Peribacillus psychrosaccharolyticus]QQT00818.1 hypothetical protein I6J18_02535 [Peribacillus psychrosaccharolyticus]